MGASRCIECELSVRIIKTLVYIFNRIKHRSNFQKYIGESKGALVTQGRQIIMGLHTVMIPYYNLLFFPHIFLIFLPFYLNMYFLNKDITVKQIWVRSKLQFILVVWLWTNCSHPLPLPLSNRNNIDFKVLVWDLMR